MNIALAPPEHVRVVVSHGVNILSRDGSRRQFLSAFQRHSRRYQPQRHRAAALIICLVRLIVLSINSSPIGPSVAWRPGMQAQHRCVLLSSSPSSFLALLLPRFDRDERLRPRPRSLPQTEVASLECRRGGRAWRIVNDPVPCEGSGRGFSSAESQFSEEIRAAATVWRIGRSAGVCLRT
jgi:hypothetical protein